MNIGILIMKYSFSLQELDGGRLLCKAFEQSKFLASCGMHSWYYYADLELRNIIVGYNCRSRLFMIDQVRDIYMQKWFSGLQRGGTKRDTYLDITGGIFKAQAYLEEIKSKSNRRKLAFFRTGSHVPPY